MAKGVATNYNYFSYCNLQYIQFTGMSTESKMEIRNDIMYRALLFLICDSKEFVAPSFTVHGDNIEDNNLQDIGLFIYWKSINYNIAWR